MAKSYGTDLQGSLIKSSRPSKPQYSLSKQNNIFEPDGIKGSYLANQS